MGIGAFEIGIVSTLTVLYLLLLLAPPIIAIVAIIALKKALAKDQSKKIPRRSISDKIIGGVCGRIANYFGINPTIIRCIWVLAMFLAGTGLLLYVICWIVMPKETYYMN